MLSIPLAWGDLDLNASGTVTDVRPDGRVLAFGHAMFGQGPLAVPMATGFVHMLMALRSSSFKIADSALLVGSVVRDENHGIVGVAGAHYTSAPAHLVINVAGQKRAEYHYQIVQHKMLTPVLATIVSSISLTAKQTMPIENTAHITGALVFAGRRTLHVDLLVPDLSEESLMLQLLPPLGIMIQNSQESMMLESMDLTFDIEPRLRIAAIANARLDRAEVAPGENAWITVRLHPYHKPAFDLRINLPIPADLPEGDYQVLVCDANSYLQNLVNSRPHLTHIASASELYAMVKKIIGLPSDAIYIVLQEKPDGVAIGQQELPNLPSSRRAIIAQPTNSIATPYADSIEKVVRVDDVTDGNVDFTLTVKKKTDKD